MKNTFQPPFWKKTTKSTTQTFDCRNSLSLLPLQSQVLNLRLQPQNFGLWSNTSLHFKNSLISINLFQRQIGPMNCGQRLQKNQKSSAVRSDIVTRKISSNCGNVSGNVFWLLHNTLEVKHVSRIRQDFPCYNITPHC